MIAISESACQFGPQSKLVGILTEPPQARAEGAPDARYAMILVSAGLLPKFGPFRLYVQLARRLAASGIPTLRFDLGGIGDSELAFAHHPLKKRTELEVRAAIDWICARYRLDGVYLAGLCSGAEDAFRIAEQDERVRGVALIDPFAYRTAGWKWRYTLHRLIRRTLRLTGHYDPVPEAGVGSLVDYQYMELTESSRILKILLSRGLKLHFAYTGGMLESFNHPGQLREMFKGIEWGSQVSVHHLPQMGHTQLLEEDRQALVESLAAPITRWAKN